MVAVWTSAGLDPERVCAKVVAAGPFPQVSILTVVQGSRAVHPPAQSHGRAAPGASLLSALLSLWPGPASESRIKH